MRLRSAVAIALVALTVSPTTTTAEAAPSGGGGPTIGHWSVTASGADGFKVSWTSPTPLPMGSDRPTILAPPQFRVGPAVSNGRTVSALVTGAAAPDPSKMDVVLSGDRLDAAGDDRHFAAPAFVAPATSTSTPSARAARTLPVDPGRRGPYAVTSSDYTLPSIKIPGLRTAVEMIGHVVEPAPGSVDHDVPLVLFEHGRHSVCYRPGHPMAGTEAWPCRAPFREIPSQLGYDYLQRLLASQGFVTVSIRTNGINAQDGMLEDSGMAARALLIRRHLDHWVDVAATHHVDLSRVVLIGHSRGGEGVVRAALQIPLSAPYRIVGQVLIAPTDFASQAAGYIPSVTLLPYCDGDVSELEGQRYTDVARDLTTDDPALRSSVLLMGANHNFFNTEWTPGTAAAPSGDDWGGAARAGCGRKNAGRLTAGQQRRAADVYVAGAVRLFTGEKDLLPLFDGSAVTVPSLGGAHALSSAIGGGRSTRSPAQANLAPDAGAAERWCDGQASYEPGTAYSACGDGMERSSYVTPNWSSREDTGPIVRRFLEVSWTKAGEAGGMRFGRPLDLSADRLELRTILDPAAPVSRFAVEVTDRAGHSAVLNPSVAPVALPRLVRGTKVWAQTTVADASSARGVDLSNIVGVGLVGRSQRGRVWVADVSAAPDALPGLPARRLPLLDVGSPRVKEGDRPHARANVPVTVRGTLTRPARVVVQYAGPDGKNSQRFTLEIAPRTRRVQIPVVFSGNKVRDYERLSPHLVALWALSGAMPDRYIGGLTVVDDDRKAPPRHFGPAARMVR